MSLPIIKSNPIIARDFVSKEQPCLNISEFFCDTIQGEGINIGSPAAFLRLQGCTLNCKYCDTSPIWKKGNPYPFEELFQLMEGVDLITKFGNGQYLVLTGGSPLLQEYNLNLFITSFISKYGFKPYIEIENECVLSPHWEITEFVDCWNNSPKLKSSGNEAYYPAVIKKTASLDNSWFKFVISSEQDWIEIYNNYLISDLINKEQIILMPLASNLRQLEKARPLVVELAIKNNVKYCTREHVVLWGSQTGV